MAEERNDRLDLPWGFAGPTLEQVRNSTVDELLKPDRFSCKCTPLGHAIKYRITLEALTLWLDRAPNVISIRNEHGNIALSQIDASSQDEQAMLIANRTRIDDLLLLDNDGDTPFHCILQNRASDDVLRATMEKCPLQVFAIVNKKGKLPIHEAIEHNAALDIVQDIIAKSPSYALKLPDADGRLLLHLLSHRTPLAVAELLIRLSGTDALSQVDDKGMLPLHCAVVADADIQIISLLVEKSPNDALYTDDAKGRFPLHLALDQPLRPSGALVDLLLGHSPHRALLKRDESERLPLYIAISSSAMTLDAIRVLVERSPCDMMAMELRDGKNALSCAVEKFCSADIVRYLMNHSPSEVLSGFDSNGKRVLHYIQQNLTNPNVVELLVENNPDMLQSRDNDGKTPMHYAMERGLMLSVVERLIDKCPESLAIPDKDGRLPVHFLSHTTREVQRMIVENSITEHLLVADSEGQLPIHRAILGCTSKEIIELLADRCPASLLHYDDSGRLPLHHALAVEYRSLYTQIVGDTNEEVDQRELGHRRVRYRRAERRRQEAVSGLTRLLAERAAESLAMVDFEGQIVLHRLCHYPVPPFLVQVLIRLCPEALKIADNKGRLPLHYALEMKRPFETIEVLLESFPGAVTIRDERDRVPLHIASDENASLDVLYKIVRWSPESLTELCGEVVN